MPRLANPFRWDCVFETDRAMYRSNSLYRRYEGRQRFVMRNQDPELKGVVDYVSQQSPPEYFLNFARFPVMKLADPDCTTRTLVQLADLRYTEPGRSTRHFSLECQSIVRARFRKMNETKNSDSLPSSPKYSEERERAKKRSTIASVRVSPGPYLALASVITFIAALTVARHYDAPR
jgi:hypothetical protein